MASRRKDEKTREKELRALWHKFQIDPEVAKRVDQLGEQGRSEEQGALIREYVRAHPALMEKLLHGPEAYERGEYVPFKDLKRKSLGRPRV